MSFLPNAVEPVNVDLAGRWLLEVISPADRAGRVPVDHVEHRPAGTPGARRPRSAAAASAE